MEIEQIIIDMVKGWGKTAYEINNGECEEFAEALAAKVQGAETIQTEQFVKDEEIDSLTGHIWVLYRGKHYDAENPFGVDNFRDLAVFKRALVRGHSRLLVLEPRTRRPRRMKAVECNISGEMLRAVLQTPPLTMDRVATRERLFKHQETCLLCRLEANEQ